MAGEDSNTIHRLLSLITIISIISLYRIVGPGAFIRNGADESPQSDEVMALDGDASPAKMDDISPREDINFFVPQFEETKELCRGSDQNSSFTMDPENDDRSDKYQPAEGIFDYGFTKKASYMECIDDLLTMQNLTDIEDIELPKIRDSDLRIPFFVLPESLPESAREDSGSTRWSECWEEVNNNTEAKPTHEWVKRTYGYHLARQLENHPWRVFNPDDALIYIIPYFDRTGKIKADSEDCDPIFKYGSIKNHFKAAAENYPDHLTSANTIVFIGTYFNIWSWYDKKWPKITAADKTVDYRQHSDAFQPIIGTFHLAPERQAVRSTSMFHPNIVNQKCNWKRDQIVCREHENKILDDATLTISEWKKSRPFKFANFGQTFNRAVFATRRAFSAANHLLMGNGRHTGIPEPYVYMMRNTAHQKHDLISTCFDGQIQQTTDLLDAWSNANPHDDLSGLGSLCWDVLTKRPATKEIAGAFPTITDLLPRPTQDFLRERSQFVISMRGGVGHSQRSYEGLYFGSLTHHDISEDHFSYYTVLPNSLPWRLLGMWDNDVCIGTLATQLLFDSGRQEVKYLDSKKVEKVHDKDFNFYVKEHTDQWSDNDLLRWASDFIQCHQPFFDLMTSPDQEQYLNVMRHAIYEYRRDVLLELENSRVAENLLFEAARMLNRHDPELLERFKSDKPRHQTWESLGITEDSFSEPNVPRSCLISGGKSPYELGFGKWNEELWNISEAAVRESLMFFHPDERIAYNV